MSDDDAKIFLGCAGMLLYAAVTCVLSFFAVYFACRLLWRMTGNDGYMRVGWAFVFLAWPVVFVAGIFVIVPMMKRRKRRLREDREDFEITDRDEE